MRRRVAGNTSRAVGLYSRRRIRLFTRTDRDRYQTARHGVPQSDRVVYAPSTAAAAKLQSGWKTSIECDVVKGGQFSCTTWQWTRYQGRRVYGWPIFLTCFKGWRKAERLRARATYPGEPGKAFATRLARRLLSFVVRLAKLHGRDWRLRLIGSEEKAMRSLLARRPVGVPPRGAVAEERHAFVSVDELTAILHPLFSVARRRLCLVVSHLPGKSYDLLMITDFRVSRREAMF